MRYSFPEHKKAKAYKLSSEKYTKLADIVNDILELELENCKINLDFSKVWI